MIHSFHLLNYSPWPFLLSFSLFGLLICFVLFLLNVSVSFFFLLTFTAFFYCFFAWVLDILYESYFLGSHTPIVQRGFLLGFVLFVLSECCIFLSLFFSFFFNFFLPSIEFASLYPSFGLSILNSYSLPLLNTAFLFFSGILATSSFNYFLASSPFYRLYLFLTLLFGVIFSYFQFFEFLSSPFSFSDSVFGSNFFLLTGFHGLHVIIGIFFLFLSFFKFFNLSFANLYWHFVDYVWILLFLFLY